MAILNNSNAISTAGGYDINNSLRFRSSASAYLNRTPGSAGNRQTWTYSAWVKRGAIGIDAALLTAGTLASTDTNITFNTSTDTLTFFYNRTSGATLNSTQVFRDPSAWYHIVVAVDTTQATASNRVKAYVNGSQVTAFSTASYPALNEQTSINNNVLHYISRIGSAYYFDGYLAEVNLIDGQQLTPSSFGSTNSLTGVWQPAKYTGTYGTNGFYLPFSLNTTSTYAGSFNGSSQSLNVPASSNLAFNANLTIEAWVYPTTSSNTRSIVVSRSTNASTSGYAFGLNSSNQLFVYRNAFLGTSTAIPYNDWSHVAWVRSGTTNTFYVNGIASGTFTDGSNYTDPSTNATYIGMNQGSAEYFAGNISNLRINKGTAVYTANFIPPTSALTAISGTQLLTLQNATIIDNSTNAFTITNTGSVTTATATPFVANIAADASGNNNSWATNNINYSAVGTTYDAMIDSPTNASASGTQPVGNYPVMNPLTNLAGLTVSNANLNVSIGNGSSWKSVVSTMALPSTGKWYWEVTVVTGTGSTQEIVGVANTVDNISSSYSGSTANTYGYQSNGSKNNNAGGVAYGSSYTTGDVIGVAVDTTAGTIVFYKNNVSQGTAFTGLSSSYSYVAASSILGATSNFATNFGQRPFAYTPPSGYQALCSTNLPDSTIVQGNKYMDASLYTGTGATQSITNTAGFKPDFIWFKGRNNATDHQLVDSVRGTSLYISSNLTSAEATNTTCLTAFNSNGFALGNNSSTSQRVNYSGDTMVGWQWQAGQGSTSSNTNGSITSTVSVNTTAGFSIATFAFPSSGTSSTVGHGLGVAPKMVIIKSRSSGTASWVVYHASITNANYLLLNSTNALNTSVAVWNNTSPDNSVVTLGSTFVTANYGANGVMYAWAEIAGFSKFGSYTGNGSSDGTFVYTGFRPKFLMWKRTDTGATNWNIIDTSRNTYNVTGESLEPNLSDAGAVYTLLDILSNGFKNRNTYTDTNASGGTYIYAAFAENPFKNSLAR